MRIQINIIEREPIWSFFVFFFSGTNMQYWHVKRQAIFHRECILILQLKQIIIFHSVDILSLQPYCVMTINSKRFIMFQFYWVLWNEQLIRMQFNRILFLAWAAQACMCDCYEYSKYIAFSFSLWLNSMRLIDQRTKRWKKLHSMAKPIRLKCVYVLCFEYHTHTVGST